MAGSLLYVRINETLEVLYQKKHIPEQGQAAFLLIFTESQGVV